MHVTPLLVMTTMAVAQAPDPLEVQRFVQEVKRSKCGMFVCLDQRTSPVVTLLFSEDLEPFELAWKIVAGGTDRELAKYLRDRFGWGKVPRWGVLNAKGDLVIEGEGLPTASKLKEMLESAGLQGPIQTLKAFLVHHPQHAEVRETLIQHLLKLASRKTERLMDSRVEPEDRAAEEGPEPPRLLSEEEDERIWGEVSALVLKHFQEGDWSRGKLSMVMLDLSGGNRSERFREVAAHCLPMIESELERYPSSFEMWDLWLGFSSVLGGRPIQPLLSRLQPMPGTPPEAWPPSSVVDRMVRDARQRRDWTAIQALLWPRWEAYRLVRSHVGLIERGDSGDVEFSSLDGEWEHWLEPLVEALLQRGFVDLADSVVVDLVSRMGWTDVKSKACEVARRCGRTALASRWEKLTKTH